MNKFDLFFEIINEGELVKLNEGEKTAFELSFEKGEVTAKAYYSLKEKPLILKGDAKLGDKVKIRFYPYRIELYVNGILFDEEWPFGDALIEKTKQFSAIAKPFEEANDIIPSVTGTFKNAEGWRPEEKVYVGDCMPYTYNGRYHVLYLKDRHNHRSKWGKGAHQWAHISTEDFINWNTHPMAIEIDDPMEGSICTGSFIEANNKQYLYYTVRMSDGSSAPIMRAVASDGYHFTKDKNFSFRLSEKYTGESARDPKVIADSEGVYHMFVTSSMVEERRGCLVHLTSKDTETWKEESEPIYVSPSTDEPECSDYFYYKGHYYLIFSLRGVGKYLYSEKPFTDWKVPFNPDIPCKTVPKAAIYGDKIIFTGYNNLIKELYAGTMTFKEAEVNEKGEMIFKD